MMAWRWRGEWRPCRVAAGFLGDAANRGPARRRFAEPFSDALSKPVREDHLLAKILKHLLVVPEDRWSSRSDRPAWR